MRHIFNATHQRAARESASIHFHSSIIYTCLISKIITKVQIGNCHIAPGKLMSKKYFQLSVHSYTSCDYKDDGKQLHTQIYGPAIPSFVAETDWIYTVRNGS